MFRLRLWGRLWEMLLSHRPPALTELPLPPCPDSLTMAGVQGGGSVLSTASVRCGKAGAGVVMNLTPQPPPFPVQPVPSPDSAPWAALGNSQL